MEFHVGMEVGAKRWPMFSAHPDCWKPPYKGTIVEKTDPRAWPWMQVDDIESHVITCETHGMLNCIPVVWNFDGKEVVFWETKDSLRPYEIDHQEWFDLWEFESARQQI